MAQLDHEVTDQEKFLFDLNGYIVVRGVFSPSEIVAANAAVDAHAAALLPRNAVGLRNAKEGCPLSAPGPRLDMGGMLFWDETGAKLFRDVLAHPRLVPYFRAFCGEGYRLDHQPLLIAQNKDSEGFNLHGGPLSAVAGSAHGRMNPELQYRCSSGEIWTSLLAAAVSLCDHNPGDGGFCVLRGSHKLNLTVPPDFAAGSCAAFDDHIHQPSTKAGDVVIWSEATVHGATPWRAERQRRIALYRFAPPNMSYGRGYLEVPQEKLEKFTTLQRAVLEPPYACRLERPLVTAKDAKDTPDGPATKKLRSAVKKDFDRQLFGVSAF